MTRAMLPVTCRAVGHHEHKSTRVLYHTFHIAGNEKKADQEGEPTDNADIDISDLIAFGSFPSSTLGSSL